VRSAMASTSWNAPRPALCVSLDPARNKTGHELALACGIYHRHVRNISKHDFQLDLHQP
jgi:hypothetical protein